VILLRKTRFLMWIFGDFSTSYCNFRDLVYTSVGVIVNMMSDWDKRASLRYSDVDSVTMVTKMQRNGLSTHHTEHSTVGVFAA
jgi:hypothetical protein